METKHQYKTIEELLEALPPYISTHTLTRICSISERQMLQYKGDFKKITPKNIALINEKMRTFAPELSEAQTSWRMSVIYFIIFTKSNYAYKIWR